MQYSVGDERAHRQAYEEAHDIAIDLLLKTGHDDETKHGRQTDDGYRHHAVDIHWKHGEWH